MLQLFYLGDSSPTIPTHFFIIYVIILVWEFFFLITKDTNIILAFLLHDVFLPI